MPKYTNLKIEEFDKLILEDPDAIILDVRTESEFAAGHLKNAINMPNIKEHIESLDQEKKIFVHCRVGGRSAVAAHILANNGFKHVFNLSDELHKTSITLHNEALNKSNSSENVNKAS